MRTILIVVIGILLSLPAFGQEPKPDPVPETPAFEFLGVTPQTVSRPTTVRALGTELLSAIGTSGEVKQGLALDFAPWALIPGMKISAQDYRTHWWAFAAANTQLSIASVRATAPTDATDVAVGLRITLFDNSDPMGSADFQTQLAAAESTECPLPPPLPPPTKLVLNEVLACKERINLEERKKWLEDQSNWNNSALAFGVATGWRVTDVLHSPVYNLGVRTWLTFAYPLFTIGQITADGRINHLIPAAGASGVTSYDFGARLSLGGSAFQFYADATGSGEIGTSGGPKPLNGTWSTGIEFTITKGLWVATGLKGDFDPTTPTDISGLLTNLRWGIRD